MRGATEERPLIAYLTYTKHALKIARDNAALCENAVEDIFEKKWQNAKSPLSAPIFFGFKRSRFSTFLTKRVKKLKYLFLKKVANLDLLKRKKNAADNGDLAFLHFFSKIFSTAFSHRSALSGAAAAGGPED